MNNQGHQAHPRHEATVPEEQGLRADSVRDGSTTATRRSTTIRTRQRRDGSLEHTPKAVGRVTSHSIISPITRPATHTRKQQTPQRATPRTGLVSGISQEMVQQLERQGGSRVRPDYTVYDAASSAGGDDGIEHECRSA